MLVPVRELLVGWTAICDQEGVEGHEAKDEEEEDEHEHADDDWRNHWRRAPFALFDGQIKYFKCRKKLTTKLLAAVGESDSVLKMNTTEQAKVITMCAVNEHRYQ